MRGAYQIPTNDWSARDSLAEMTEVYVRPELQAEPAIEPVPAAVIVQTHAYLPDQSLPFVPVQMPQLPAHRFELPTLATFATGSSPSVRISSPIGAPDATHRVPRQRSRSHTPLLVGGVLGAIVLGVGIGLVVAFTGGSGLPAAPTAKPAVLTVTPIATAPVKPAVTAIVKPMAAPVAAIVKQLVDVRIESQPSGGVATLIDGTNATRLGATPLAVSLDPNKSYDVMVALDGHAPRVVHVTPVANQDIVLAFDDAKPLAHHTDRKDLPAVVATKGILKIASKPPCAITVDGRPSGKTTPQAALALSVGSHEITLTNEEQGINLTTEVVISADKPATVVQDFTK